MIKAGLCEALIYAALAHTIAGAKLGLSIYRCCFARVYALTDTLIAVDDMRVDTAGQTATGEPDRTALTAHAFVDYLCTRSTTTLAQKCLYSFVDENATGIVLDTVGAWSRVALRKSLLQE